MQTKVVVSHILSGERLASRFASERFHVQVNGTYVGSPLVCLPETLIAEVTSIGLDTCVDVQVNIAILLRCEHLVALLADESAFS